MVDTLEASLWCLLQTDNYKDCVLKSINLGEDTDTTAAVVSGLAGLAYGIEDDGTQDNAAQDNVAGIPKEWIKNLAAKDVIDRCIDGLGDARA